MAVTGWKAPQTAANIDRDAKEPWTNPDNAKTDDSNVAWAGNNKGAYSDWLRLTNFWFTTADIPADAASIDGIEVQYKRECGAAGLEDEITDSAIYLRDSGGQVGDNKASPTWWALAKETKTYGGAADMWGTTLSGADIRVVTFGIDLSSLNNSLDTATGGKIYFCQIRIYYTEAGGVTHYGAATLSGVGTLAGIGRGIFIGKATLTGEGTLAAIGRGIFAGKAALAGIGSLAAKGVGTFIGKSTLSGTGTLSAIGSFLRYGKSTLSGTGTLAAIGSFLHQAKATLTGTGTLTAAGSFLRYAKATLSGSGTLTAIGEVVEAAIKYGKATLSGAGTLTAKAALTIINKATLAGIGTLSVIGQIVKLSRFGSSIPRSIPSFLRSNIQAAERQNIQVANRHNIQESKR